MLYDKHIFICTNQRKEGERICCGEMIGLDLVAAFKKLVKDNKLTTTVRAQRAGCFEICESGPNVIVYPEGIVYAKVQLSDVNEIFEEHILKDRPVQRLILTKPLPKS